MASILEYTHILSPCLFHTYVNTNHTPHIHWSLHVWGLISALLNIQHTSAIGLCVPCLGIIIKVVRAMHWVPYCESDRLASGFRKYHQHMLWWCHAHYWQVNTTMPTHWGTSCMHTDPANSLKYITFHLLMLVEWPYTVHKANLAQALLRQCRHAHTQNVCT